jgi:hypothetical protein
MVNMTWKILKWVGVNPKRLALEWVSAGEGMRFAEIVTKFTSLIRELGPLGQDEGSDGRQLFFKLEAAKRAAEGEKMRWILGKHTELSKDGNVYGEVFTQHEIGRVFDLLSIEEITNQEILLLLEDGNYSVKEMAQRLSLPPAQVLRQVQALRRKGFLESKEIRGSSPIYSLVSKEVQSGN